MRHENVYPIDFVVPWVDGDDPAWQMLRAQYLGDTTENGVRAVDARASRYRDWGTLRYLLRGIDRFAPWVRTVHLVTQGHVPTWLNTTHPKLNIVRHEDYMPAEYLPTFAANAIELNLHRIDALAEHFVYFNDDMLLIDHVSPSDFFKHGKPRLVAALEPARVERKTWFYMRVTNAAIVSAHFSKYRTTLRHPLKWANIRYPRSSLKTAFLTPFGNFCGFREMHLPDPYLKSTFERVWEAEPDILDQTSRHRFRVNTDPNIWLMQDWQLASGVFCPGNERIGKAFFIYDEKDACRAERYVRNQKGKLTCLNDHVDEQDEALLEACSAHVVGALDAILPERSSFELEGMHE